MELAGVVCSVAGRSAGAVIASNGESFISELR